MASLRPYAMVKVADADISSTSSEAGSSPPNSPAISESGFLIQPKDEVRKELRDAIRTKRLAKGLDELPEVEAKKPKSEELTPEEEEKRRLRRERNKVAAFRCRQKRKQHITELEQITEQISNSNGDLEKEIDDLKAQKEQLENMLKFHACKKGRKGDEIREENKENSQEDS